MKPFEKDWISGNNEDAHGAVALFEPRPDGSEEPFDLEVYTALAMTVRPHEFSPHRSIHLTLGAGLTVYASEGQGLTPVVNTIEFLKSVSDPDSEISSLFGVYFYDVVGTRADGKVDRVGFGTITFKQGKTYDVSA
jgi:hypothetical protein